MTAEDLIAWARAVARAPHGEYSWLNGRNRFQCHPKGLKTLYSWLEMGGMVSGGIESGTEAAFSLD